MKLRSVEIHDFKSIKSETIEINTNQLCFVGKNESGKSSLILATKYLNVLDTELKSTLLNKSSDNYPNGLPVVIGIFELSKSDYSELLKISKPLLTDDQFANLPKHSENCLLQLKRWGNGFLNISLSIIEKNKFGFELSKNIEGLATFYDQFFEKLYPDIQYYENEDLLIEPSTINELLGNDKKFETFRKLLLIGGCKDFNDLNNPDINFVTTFLSDIEIKLNTIFKKHYKQDQSINIKIAPTFGDRLNLIIRDNSGKSFSISERSPGFQYYFSFLVNKLYSKELNKGRNTVILLDEPGNSLHPKGAKDLLKSFDEIAESSQILYTTHNPFLAVRNCIDSLLFINKSATVGTKINKKPFLNKYQILRKELGIMLNDSFLIGDINLIVEGNTEKLGFHRIFQFEQYQDLEWMNIYNADGVANIPQAINYLGKNNLKLSGIVILDSDSEAEGIKKNKSYKNNIKDPNWEEIEINTIFNDKKDRTFEDLFPQQNYVNAFNEYCESLSSLDVFSKKYEAFEYKEEIETPIINTLSLHFKSFLPEDSKASITKQDVIRHLLDSVDKFPEKEQKEVLSNIFKLTNKIKVSFSKIEKYVNN
ncbi:AAA family ATPase [Leptobacterium flavescens]|uniref:AAA family ATPase n=1 Tax=Leptobacterium flavescens TaxID=472055 RepID=A0A6P0URE2_9FLAO|nr:AAA family ATPase [Leptobacterium flavescens]NER15122.1 AAA family ATPase [Leptobacterium flavescens]